MNLELLKKLPESEVELMKIIWANPSPISTNQIMAQLEAGRDWKPQTVLTLLTRLIERGYLRSQRQGKERIYYPLVKREEYVAFESGSFMERFHHNSFVSLMNTLYAGNRITEQDLDELKKWLDSKG
ncbi:MAG: BlaI/MecI/CopY family transcriptional regulator [Candidatus Limiplasma sp.]|nr:BlaI/MecI/CopY family transcriptional regulator [Candidatus Limiplasma sp.]